MKKFSTTLVARIRRHKIISAIIVIVIVFAGYKTYAAVKTASAETQYILGTAQMGSIMQTVSGSGQISAENQIDVASQVSGTVQSVNVSVGDHVKAGQILAVIDSANAAADLMNAKISLSELTQPPKSGDLTNAENTLDKAYSDGFNTVRSAFIDLQTVMTDMNTLFYGQTGFLSVGDSSLLTPTGQSYRHKAGASFDSAKKHYESTLKNYELLSEKSDPESIEKIITETYDLLKKVAQSLQETQTTVTYITVNEPRYNSDEASYAKDDVSTWITTVNSNITTVGGSRNTLTSSKNSLSVLKAGADALDIQAAQLSVDKAQRTYNNYFIRAPFDGVVGKISVSKYSQAGSGTSIATVIGDKKIASISLNEVDAAKVSVGQNVKITFDAIDDFEATGTVQELDLVGSVSQGVVSYGVKIAVNSSDQRIKPGMSVNATIITKELSNVLTVPASAVKTLGGTSFVQAFDKDDVTPKARIVSSKTAPKQIKVSTGETDDTNIEIVEGLSAGDLVVTRTVNSGGTQTGAAPNILSNFGARTGGAGARPAGGVMIRQGIGG